jgi:hypothetical protein
MATKKAGKKGPKTLRDVKGTRKGTEDDLEAIENGDWCDAVEVEELRAFDGDLTIEGDYSGSGARLIVHGDLTVSGTLSLDETGTLIVTGDVRCRNLHCEGDLEIQGDVIAEETIFGFYEAGITFFDGTIKAPLFLEGNHSFEYDDDQLEVKTHLKFDNFRGLSQGTAEQARAVLSDEAFALLGEMLGLSEEDAEGEYGPLLREKGFLRR